jgi:hypothetical protein
LSQAGCKATEQLSSTGPHLQLVEAPIHAQQPPLALAEALISLLQLLLQPAALLQQRVHAAEVQLGTRQDHRHLQTVTNDKQQVTSDKLECVTCGRREVQLSTRQDGHHLQECHDLKCRMVSCWAEACTLTQPKRMRCGDVVQDIAKMKVSGKCIYLPTAAHSAAHLVLAEPQA